MAATANTAKPSIQEEIVDAFEVAGAALEKAAAAYQFKEATDRAIAGKIPEVVNALVLSGLIEPEDKEAMAKALVDPLQVLETVKLAAETVRSRQNGNTLPATQVNADGTPAHQKSASVNGKVDRRAEFERNRDAQWDLDLLSQ